MPRSATRNRSSNSTFSKRFERELLARAKIALKEYDRAKSTPILSTTPSYHFDIYRSNEELSFYIDVLQDCKALLAVASKRRRRHRNGVYK
jgi:hypothetical protein